MSLPTWIVSRSGGANSSSAKILEACRRLDLPCLEVAAIPFSTELPSIPSEILEGPLVFYGQTSFILAAYRSPYARGVWFEPEAFRPSTYLRRYGNLLLNDDQQATTIRELAASSRPDHERVFVRPDDDLKGFSGGTMRLSEFRDWRQGIGEADDGDVSADTRIVIASPKTVGREYRAVIVQGRVASLAAADGRLPTPEDVMALAKTAVGNWQPVPVFVMDVAETERGPRVLELNCFNASGLYLEDAEPIVRAVSEAVGR